MTIYRKDGIFVNLSLHHPMKRLVSSLVLGCMLLAQSRVLPAIAASDDYDDAIEYLLDEDIADGYDDGSFGENKPINRAEITKIILNAIDEEDGGSNCFLDVQRQWFAAYVCAAEDQNIVKGYPDGTFRPERNVSFAEAASLVVRAYEGSVSSSFGNNWYTPYIDTLEDWDAVPATIDAIHAPLTRGEMAYIIWRAEQEAGDADDDDEDDDDENEEELDISVSASASDVLPGGSVTFTITVENEGDEDVEVDIEASVDSGLTIQSAPGADFSDRDAQWEEEDVDEDDEETYTLTALVGAAVAIGTTLTLDVEIGDEEDDASITVKGQPQQPSVVGDPVLHWNAIALQANADDHTGTFGNPLQMGPGGSTRSLAMVHAAIFDAVNSIDKSYKPYIANVSIPVGQTANIDAAVAVAAHKTLVSLYPNMKASFDADLKNHLDKVASGTGKTLGMLVGDTAANQVINARTNDGSTSDGMHADDPSNQPGKHRADPINPGQPFLGAKWGNVKPFVIAASWQFRPTPPPAINSKEYADAFNEVKTFGGDGITTPTVRNQDQTDIGIFWAYDGVKKIGTPPRLYNQIARVIAVQKGNTIAQNARLFALINLAQADAATGCWEAKYYYDLWRPIVGIREADAGTGPTGLGDNNPDTAGDATWTPLGAPMSNMTSNNFTPPFPAYPSGHATMGEAVFRTIANFYGTNNIAFTFTSDELNGVTTDNSGVVRPLKPRSFTSLSQASQENADSRVYLGVHWRFDQTEGVKMGRSIADYVFDNSLTPIK